MSKKETSKSNDLMTAKQLAEYLSVSYTWVRRHYKKHFRFVMIEGALRFRKESVDAYLQSIEQDQRFLFA